MRDYWYIDDKKLPVRSLLEKWTKVDPNSMPERSSTHLEDLTSAIHHKPVVHLTFGMYDEGVLICEPDDPDRSQFHFTVEAPEAVVIWKKNNQVTFLVAQTFPDLVKILSDISSYEKSLTDISKQYESGRTPFQTWLRQGKPTT